MKYVYLYDSYTPQLGMLLHASAGQDSYAPQLGSYTPQLGNDQLFENAQCRQSTKLTLREKPYGLSYALHTGRYLAYKKMPTPLGNPLDPRHRPPEGAYGGAVPYN